MCLDDGMLSIDEEQQIVNVDGETRRNIGEIINKHNSSVMMNKDSSSCMMACNVRKTEEENLVEEFPAPLSPQLSARAKLLLMQRSHSLQSSLKRSGCRSSGKSVRFADWDGASLTRVRHLSADSICQRNDDQPCTSDDDDAAAAAATANDLNQISNQRIKVKLHSFSSNGLFIGGTVYVVNPRYRHGFKEQLYISVTTDNWRSFRNIRAFRHENSTSDVCSQWHFNAHLTGLYRWSRCVFKVDYVYDGQLTVDDNAGHYYHIHIEAPKRKVDHHSRESILSDLLAFDQLLIY